MKCICHSFVGEQRCPKHRRDINGYLITKTFIKIAKAAYKNAKNGYDEVKLYLGE
jgi:hypothetical protein